MLESLKFVQGAVKQKNQVAPELEHFLIKDKRIVGFNGYLALSAPIDVDITAAPKASTFVKAIEHCSTAVAIHMTKAQRLAIKSEGMRVYVPCIDESIVYPVEPKGETYAVPDGFIQDLQTVYPFISEDASRPWAMGALFKNGSYMATNNILLTQVWSGHQLPTVNVPRFVVKELLRIKETPESIKTDGTSIAFIYPGGRWMRAQLYSDEWPFEMMQEIMETEHHPVPLPPGFEETIQKIASFTGSEADPIFFEEDQITTSQTDEEGVTLSLPGIQDGPIFNIAQLKLLAKVATKADFTLHPSPCIFYGAGNLRGAISGRTG